MLFSEMIQEVKNIVQDSDFDASIPGYINEAFLQASGLVNMPDLKRIGLIDTIPGQMYASLAGLPDGFSGRLSSMVTPDIAQFDSVDALISWVIGSDRSLTEEGAVEAVALEGKTLWYFPSPAVEQTLTAVVYANSRVMTEDDDFPVEFPDTVHRNIGIHGACYLCYILIEDSIDGTKPNVEFHYSMFLKGVQMLVEWIGRHRVHLVTSTLNDNPVSTQNWQNSITRWANATVK